jgi:hypothetical protein
VNSAAQLNRLRWAVRATLTLGVATSVTANVLHATPHPISQAIAAWPPIALLLTVELVSRVPVHRRALAAARIAATAAIAGIAAWISYRHMAGVAARYGETGPAPHLLPLSVDGLIVVASISLVELTGRIRTLTTTPPTDRPTGKPVRRADPPEKPGRATRTRPARAKPDAPSAQPSTGPALPDPRHPTDPPRGTERAAPATDAPPYQPVSAADALMYQAWRTAIATGRPATGVDLAHAAGHPHDNSGIGRRAARRYRHAHANRPTAPLPDHGRTPTH